MKVLVTGFGAFPGVPVNPTAQIARAVDGVRMGPVEVTGIVLPVSFQRGPELAIERARSLPASLVIGLGVAVNRDRVWVEQCAVRVTQSRPDVDGVCATGLEGPERVLASLDVTCLVDALGAERSDDAGRYVCNAWLYQVSHSLDCPVGFVHVPPAGLDPSALLGAIAALTKSG